MAKGVRMDRHKNIAKVATAILNNPLQTEREIAKSTWIGKGTAHRAKQELGQIGAKDDRILWICDKDIENVILWQNELKKRLQKQADKLKVNDIVQIMAEWTKRYTIFKWDITDPSGWLKNVLTTEQLKILADRLSLDEQEW